MIAKTTETLNAKNTPEAKKANRFILMLKSEDTTKELKIKGFLNWNQIEKPPKQRERKTLIISAASQLSV